MSGSAIVAILGAIGAVGLLIGVLVRWGVRWAGDKGEERGELGAQAEALAEGQKRAERARKKGNKPITGNPKALAARMLARLRRHQSDLQIHDLELPPDPGSGKA